MNANVEIPPFVMPGCREVLAQYAGSVHIEQAVRGIEQSIDQNPRLAFDLCKALLETACKTILRERGFQPNNSENAQDLLKQALGVLRIIPATHDAKPRVREGLKKAINGLKTVMQGIADIRNAEGFASHGPDAFEPSLDGMHALLAARAVDAIVHFLFGCHRHFPAENSAPPTAYETNPNFNTHIDGLYDVITIFDVELYPSRVLYEMDPVAYDENLRSYMQTRDATEADEESLDPPGGDDD